MQFLRRFVRAGMILFAVALGLLFIQTYSPGFRFLDSGSFSGEMGHSAHEHEQKWWKEAVVYEIYIPSFKDSNNDGIGDLEGIISKVNYLHKLGVECVWLSPILKSPQVDMGYDISDYKVIDPQYGSIEDVDRLTKELNSRGMKLIMDLVVNHTSDQHDWFQKSRSSKDNEYRDWYIWRPARYDANGNRRPPNNWAAAFQGSAWEWDEGTQEYYLQKIVCCLFIHCLPFFVSRSQTT